MPIVEMPKPDALLSQGDILADVRVFATDACWDGKGGDSVKAPFNLCMVLSRPCVAAHKETFLVAAVDKLKDKLPGYDSFEKMLSLLTNIRDGRTSPDQFYLGQLPGKQGRYAARFDSVHTIRTPKGEDMTAFLGKCRIGTLNVEFCRDLHVRFFNAIASLGFDDHDCFSTEDLRALVDQGLADIAALDGEVAKKRAGLSARAAEGATSPQGDLEKAQQKVQELRDTLAPYQSALEKRKMT